MIGNITTGSNFRGIFNYLLKNTKEPVLLGFCHRLIKAHYLKKNDN